MPRPREFRDNDVLNRAMLLFWQQGFHATGIKQLESVTGLRTSSLYNRFGDKEGLYEAALEHYVETVVARRIERYLRHGDPLEGIRGFFRSTWDYIDDDHAPMACLLTNSALELGNRYPALRRRIDAGMQQVEQALVGALERARTSGSLPAGTEPARLGRRLAMALQGLLISTRARPERRWLRETTEAILAELPSAGKENTP